jgi:Bardet-Biedl syndrome 9 protein
VLHPRKVAVYSVQAAGASFLQLAQLYEHQLEHTAANMATGGFGGTRGAQRRGAAALGAGSATMQDAGRAAPRQQEAAALHGALLELRRSLSLPEPQQGARRPGLSDGPRRRPAVAGVDYIAVQSYDGQLSLFENERFAFARFLPGALVPGPLCYCPQLDSFVTCNAEFEIESYRWAWPGRAAARCGG